MQKHGGRHCVADARNHGEEQETKITGERKNKIDRLRELFWIGGITNPLDMVEQMTYLMFIHDLDAANQRAKESTTLGSASQEHLCRRGADGRAYHSGQSAQMARVP